MPDKTELPISERPNLARITGDFLLDMVAERAIWAQNSTDIPTL